MDEVYAGPLAALVTRRYPTCSRASRSSPGAADARRERGVGAGMISSVVVTYAVRPEASTSTCASVEAVFAQLQDEARTDVAYQVLRLADGMSFVHVSTADTPGRLESPAPAGLVPRVRLRPRLAGDRPAQRLGGRRSRVLRAGGRARRCRGAAHEGAVTR